MTEDDPVVWAAYRKILPILHALEPGQRVKVREFINALIGHEKQPE